MSLRPGIAGRESMNREYLWSRSTAGQASIATRPPAGCLRVLRQAKRNYLRYSHVVLEEGFHFLRGKNDVPARTSTLHPAENLGAATAMEVAMVEGKSYSDLTTLRE